MPDERSTTVTARNEQADESACHSKDDHAAHEGGRAARLCALQIGQRGVNDPL